MSKPKRSLEDGGKRDYHYISDDDGSWHRVYNTSEADAFESIVVRPKKSGGNKYKHKVKIDNSLEGTKRRDKYLSTHYENGMPIKQGIDIVSPEFDIISLGGLTKNILGGIKYIGKKAKGLASKANWQGDAVALTKDRLANGGFDRLSNTFNSNITNEAVNLETANPLLIKNSNLPLVYSPERRATLLATDVHEVPSWYATGNPKHIGVSNAELGPVLYSDRPAQYMGRQASSDIAAHEYSHYVYTPNERLSTEMFQPVEGYTKYFRKANNAEVQARGTQLKNYFGLREGEPLTAEHIKYAAKHFVKDRGYDNGMTEFFKSIKDFDGVAKWLTKNAPAYGIGTTLTYGAGNYTFNEQRPQQRNGGSIHIAPSKRGTFTAAATKHGMGVQEFASRVLRNKDNYSPAMVKKANFARNASKWNH